MLRLYMMRHGETVWNTERRYQGMTDIELSEEGLRQAQCAAERFKSIDIDKIYCSPLKRAAATAKPIAEEKNLEINVTTAVIVKNKPIFPNPKSLV